MGVVLRFATHHHTSSSHHNTSSHIITRHHTSSHVITRQRTLAIYSTNLSSNNRSLECIKTNSNSIKNSFRKPPILQRRVRISDNSGNIPYGFESVSSLSIGSAPYLVHVHCQVQHILPLFGVFLCDVPKLNIKEGFGGT